MLLVLLLFVILMRLVKLDNTYMLNRYIVDLARLRFRYLVVFSRTLELNNGYCCRFLAMTFTVQEKDQILSNDHNTQSTTVIRRWICRTLHKSSPYLSDLNTKRLNNWIGRGGLLVTALSRSDAV